MRTGVQRTSSLAGVLLWVLLSTGCASIGNGSLTLKQLRLDVGWKMEAYQDAVAFRYVTGAQKQQVSAAYQAYQTAFHQALAAAQGNLGTPAPDNVQHLANQLISAIDGVLSTLAGHSPPRNEYGLMVQLRTSAPPL